MEGKTNFVLIGIIVFLSVAVAFIVIYLVMTGGANKPSANTANNKTHTEEQKKVEIDYKKFEDYLISEMIINLKSDEKSNKTIIKVDVCIRLADVKFGEEFKKRESEVKDIIRSTFGSKTANEVDDIPKIDKVKDELLKKFRAMYHEPKEANKILQTFIPSSLVQ